VTPGDACDSNAESRFVEAPIAIVSPKRTLELMLNVEEPHSDRSADDRDRSLDKKKRTHPHPPDQ
jgi:hypothetical protein